jgi:hypothetical protein
MHRIPFFISPKYTFNDHQDHQEICYFDSSLFFVLTLIRSSSAHTLRSISFVFSDEFTKRTSGSKPLIVLRLD